MMVSEKINVLMDGIKDVGMMMDYAEEAMKTGDSESHDWFLAHAAKRMEWVDSDFAYLKNQLNMEQRIRNGDGLAEAFHSYLNMLVCDLRSRYERMA